MLYALVQKDLKRLLAFSSLENIGIILMGIGASLMLSSFRQPVLAALALVAALYHTLNHACFKGLLFLGAGAVLNGAHTKDLEKLGGLIRRMPKTAFFFLLGAIALCGFPPLNGFVSEWLTYQALLQGFGATGPARPPELSHCGGLAGSDRGSSRCLLRQSRGDYLPLPSAQLTG